ncbi:MAG: DUF885 domain-containing protein [Candidatus Binatia bacterium]
MRRHLLLPAVFLILGCAADPRWNSLDRREEAAAEARKLHQMFDQYFEEYLQLFPTVATSIGDHRYDDRLGIAISEEHRGEQRDLYRKYLGALEGVIKERLEREDRLNHAVFERLLTQRLETLRFEQHLQPVRQIQSTAVEFPLLGSGRGVHPFKSVADYENFLRRIERFQNWVDTAIANMRRGVERGIVPSRVVIERTLPQIDAMIVDDPRQSLFFRPVLEMPDHFGEAEKRRLTQDYTRAVEEQIVPAYRKLRDFLRDEYLTKTRATTGMSGLPEGNAWYDHLVKTRTTTSLTPEQIFELGLSEIARINRERERMRAESGFQGSLRQFAEHLRRNSPPGFRTKEELLKGYETIRAQVTPRLSDLFGRLPNAPYEIRTVEEFRENSSPSQYHAASPDGSRPGIFYVNARGVAGSPRRPSEALFLHEAVPGHHFQISLQRERSALPRFRRFSGYTAFVEGWALYAESLGRELGLYSEPQQYFSRLNSELFRAVRLVVDVGLHRKGWTREQALKFMMEHTMASESGAALEIDRYIALPGQALAYKIGQLKISEIRTRAERMLGPRFDVRAFHDELLKDGALPLDLLEAKMDAWMESQPH